MFVLSHGNRGRVVVHCAECALLDGDYYEPGRQETAETLDAAHARAEALRCRARFCAWCQPDATKH